MKTKALYFFCCLMIFSLLGCNKHREIKKKLVGDWVIYNYKQTNNLGFAKYYASSGTMTYSKFEKNTSFYSLNLKINKANIIEDFVESGRIELQNDRDLYTVFRNNNDGTVKITPNVRFILLSKKELYTEFTNEFGTHSFVFTKKQ